MDEIKGFKTTAWAAFEVDHNRGMRRNFAIVDNEDDLPRIGQDVICYCEDVAYLCKVTEKVRKESPAEWIVYFSRLPDANWS